MKKYLERGCEIMLTLIAVVAMTGCQAMNQTMQKISDDLGDKALQAHALVDIWKIEMSDSTGNAVPTGKKITVIGDVKSIPLVSKDGQTVKDYAEYRNTETPAWYNSDNVTKEEVFIGTGDNAQEVINFLKWKKAKAAEKAKAESEQKVEGEKTPAIPAEKTE